MDVIEQHIPKILNSILDFQGDDQAFYELMKSQAENFVTELVNEIEGGF